MADAEAGTEQDASAAPTLELSLRLDRPFHELKDSLLTEFERAYLVRILTEAAMNLSMASRASGLSRKHIRTLMAKHGIRRADFAATGSIAVGTSEMPLPPSDSADSDDDDALSL